MKNVFRLGTSFAGNEGERAAYRKVACFESAYLFDDFMYLFHCSRVERTGERDPVQNKNRIKSAYKIAVTFKRSNTAFNSAC